MATKANAAAPQAGNQEQELFLDILTKEEKEALLNMKMEEIRRKNQELTRRHAEIEADRRAAERHGIAVSRKQNVSVSSPPQHSQQQPQHQQQHQQQQNPQQQQHQQQQHPMKGVPNNEGRRHTKPSGRGRRLKELSQQQKLKAQETEDQSRGKNAAVKSPTTDGPPPDPGYNFLSDRSRQGDYQPPDKPSTQSSDARRNTAERRHPRNFGGASFDNAKAKIQADKEKGQFRRGPPATKMEMAMQMTGKERREYQQWKEERDLIDKARVERQKSKGGDWKREWDVDKPDAPQPPVSHHLEPARRPAGRIGSGRFASASGERDDKAKPEPKAGPQSTRGGPTRGRGGRSPQHESSKPPRFRNTSQSSDDSSRFVEEQNDSLVVKIDNEFAVSPTGSQSSPRSPIQQPPFQRSGSSSGRFRKTAPRFERSQRASDDVFEAVMPAQEDGGRRGGWGGFRGGSSRGEPYANRGRGRGDSRGGRGSRGSRGDSRGGRGGSRPQYGDSHTENSSPGRGRGTDSRGGRGSSRGRGGPSDRGTRRGGFGTPQSQQKTVTFKPQPTVYPQEELEWDPTTETEFTGGMPRKTILNPAAAEFNPGKTVSPTQATAPQTGDDWDVKEKVETEEEQPLEPKPQRVQQRPQQNGQIDSRQSEKPMDTQRERPMDTPGSVPVALPEQTVTQNRLQNGDYPEPIEDVDLDDSAESLDRFIQAHTLKLDVDAAGNVSLTPSSEIQSQSSQDSFMKTPTGHVHVPDWSSAMEGVFSPKEDKVTSDQDLFPDIGDSPGSKLPRDESDVSLNISCSGSDVAETLTAELDEEQKERTSSTPDNIQDQESSKPAQHEEPEEQRKEKNENENSTLSVKADSAAVSKDGDQQTQEQQEEEGYEEGEEYYEEEEDQEYEDEEEYEEDEGEEYGPEDEEEGYEEQDDYDGYYYYDDGGAKPLGEKSEYPVETPSEDTEFDATKSMSDGQENVSSAPNPDISKLKESEAHSPGATLDPEYSAAASSLSKTSPDPPPQQTSVDDASQAPDNTEGDSPSGEITSSGNIEEKSSPVGSQDVGQSEATAAGNSSGHTDNTAADEPSTEPSPQIVEDVQELSTEDTTGDSPSKNRETDDTVVSVTGDHGDSDAVSSPKLGDSGVAPSATPVGDTGEQDTPGGEAAAQGDVSPSTAQQTEGEPSHGAASGSGGADVDGNSDNSEGTDKAEPSE